MTVQCPNCQRENKTGSRFCIFCGSSLQKPSEATEVPAPGTADTQPPQLQALREEVRRLTERLNTLERALGITIPPSRPTPTIPTATTSTPEAIPKTVSKGMPHPPSQPGESPVAKAKEKEKEWEQILGGNWLARIGVLLLIIGIAFFLKYAFDNDWLNPTTRVILGVLGGTALLWGGYHWQGRYPIFAQALSGGGIALLYLSIFAAFAVFEMIPFYPAMAILVLISAGSVVIAIRYNSMSLAILGIIGAFSAPFVLGVSAPETNGIAETGQGFQLLAYVMVVDLGVIALSTIRNWQWFTLIGLLGSLAAFGAWNSHYGDRASLLTSEGSLTLIFLIFVGATTLYHIVWRRAPRDFDYILMVINAAAYLGISYGLLWDDLREWLGGFSLLLSFFYGGLAYIAYKRRPENLKLSLFALGITLVFLTITIPVQWGDSAWTTVVWAAEGVVLLWLSFTLRIIPLRVCSYAIYALTAIRLIFFDTTVVPSDFHLVFNERFLAFTVGIAALYLAAYLLWRERNVLLPWEKDLWSAYPIFFVAANVFSIWLLSFEAWDYFGSRDSQNAQVLSLTAIWAIYAVILLVVGIIKRSPLIRLMALTLLAITIVKVFVYDVFTLERVYRIIAFTGLGLLLIVSGYLYQRYSKAIKGFIFKG